MLLPLHIARIEKNRGEPSKEKLSKSKPKNIKRIQIDKTKKKKKTQKSIFLKKDIMLVLIVQ